MKSTSVLNIEYYLMHFNMLSARLKIEKNGMILQWWFKKVKSIIFLIPPPKKKRIYTKMLIYLPVN